MNIALTTILAFSLHGAPADSPRFERGGCRPAVEPGERVECGMLVVPENRARKGSDLIRIPVKIFRSRSAVPRPDPVLFMLGGPGGATRTTSGKGIPMLDERDYIVFDQRGTRLAEPVLDCPEFNVVKGRVARGLVRGRDAEAELTAGAATCAANLRKRGIDLDGYNSNAIADDVEDLRRVLGIAQWNLYGVSYSARVMLDVIRKYPSSIRSVILDSPLSPESRYDETAASGMIRALNIVFDACAAMPDCDRAHPRARANMATAIDRFDRAPQKVYLDSTGTDSIIVGGAQLAEAFASLLNSPSTAALIPLAADRASEGNVGMLAPIFSENVQPGSYAYGMRLAVWCSEVMPFQNRAAVASQHAPEKGLGGAIVTVIPPAGCDSMRVKPTDSLQALPVRSDIPTLILSGELDAYVSTPWARAVLRNMSKGFLVEMRAAGHGPGFSRCGQQVIAEFLHDPSKPPAVECAFRNSGLVFTR